MIQYMAMLVSVGVQKLFKSNSICKVNKCLCISVILVTDVNIKVPEYD